VHGEPVAQAGAAPRPVRRGLRRSLAAVAVLVLLAVAGGAGWSYLRSQYYVGVDGENVAIFRGVNGSVAGVRFAAVEQPTSLTTGRLDAIYAAQVEKGIVAADRDDAERIVDRLVDRFPPCDEQPAASPRPTPTPSTSLRSTLTPSASPTPTASPAPSASRAAGAAADVAPCPVDSS
jgi:protein phosphatase